MIIMDADSQTGKGHGVYIGTESGILKAVTLSSTEAKCKNFNNLNTINKHNEICCMSWGGVDESEICLGLSNQMVKIFDIHHQGFSTCMDVKGGTGPVKGIGKYQDSLLTAVESGLVKVWRFIENEQIEIHAVGTDTKLEKMRQNRTNSNMIGTGGKESDLQIWDLNAPDKPIFKAKNVSCDSLDLRVPVWVSDLSFLPNSQKVALSSRHGHIRLYDPTTTQRRPVVNITLEDQSLTSISPTTMDNQVIVGSTRGNMSLVDFRKCKVVQTYKGFTGSIRDIICMPNDPFVVSVSLDRHIRVHNINTKELVLKSYLKSRLNCVVIKSDFKFKSNDSDGEDECDKTENIIDMDDPFHKMPVVGQKRKQTENIDSEPIKRHEK